LVDVSCAIVHASDKTKIKQCVAHFKKHYSGENRKELEKQECTKIGNGKKSAK